MTDHELARKQYVQDHAYPPPPGGPQRTPDPDGWTSVLIRLPGVEAAAVVSMMRTAFHFTDEDWTEITRPDGARLSWGPAHPVPKGGAKDHH